jgi:hypothetical protein
MRAFFIMLALIACALPGISGCTVPLPAPSGVMTRESRIVDTFSSLQLSSGLRATVTAGASQSLVVVGDTNLVGLVRASVAGGVLTVSLMDPYRATADDPLHVEISAPALSALTVDGTAQLTASRMVGDVLVLDASGASSITIDGTASQVKATASGGSHMEARALTARDVSLEGSGASFAEVCAQSSIDLHLSGASRALYACNPSSITTDLSGASTAQAE